jgi:hypothetical protein
MARIVRRGCGLKSYLFTRCGNSREPLCVALAQWLGVLAGIQDECQREDRERVDSDVSADQLPAVRDGILLKHTLRESEKSMKPPTD